MPPENATVFSRQWNPSALLRNHVLAFLLLGSFILPEGQALWRQLDHSIFFALNGSLEDTTSWARFWAWANVRSSDIATGMIMIISLTFPGLGMRRVQLQGAFIGFIFVLLFVMFPIRYALHALADVYGLTGPSASLTLEPAFRLSELAPDIPAKDASLHSFPGDHAAVLWCWAGVLIYNMKQRALCWVPIMIAMAFMLPRIVGGAHWASDILVGGGFVGLLTLSWCFHTPLVQQVTDALTRLLQPVIRLFSRIPGLGQLPFFNP